MILYTVIGVLTFLFCYIILWRKQEKRFLNAADKYVLVTGCDSGFGYDTAKRLDFLGFNVFATCLTEKGEKLIKDSCSERVEVIRLDVTIPEQITAAYDYVQRIISSDNRGLWAVVNNAGIVAVGPLDWQNVDEMKKVVDVNLWGLINVTKTFLPLIKESQGRLVNVASIGGRLSFPYIGAYCMSKFAVEAFTDALRRELCRWNIKIIIIEPGFHKTNMTERKAMSDRWEKIWENLSDERKTEYGEGFFVQSKENFLTGVVDKCVALKTDEVINTIVDAVELVNPKARYVVGWDAKYIWVWIARMPTLIGDTIVTWIANIVKPQSVQKLQK